jgi:hypothetical protein
MECPSGAFFKKILMDTSKWNAKSVTLAIVAVVAALGILYFLIADPMGVWSGIVDSLK